MQFMKKSKFWLFLGLELFECFWVLYYAIEDVEKLLESYEIVFDRFMAFLGFLGVLYVLCPGFSQ